MYGPVISELIRTNSIAEIWDPRSGHWNGLVNGLDGTPSAGMRQTGPGGSWVLPNVTDEVTVADDPLLRLDAGSIVFVCEHGFTSQVATEYLLAHDVAGSGYSLGVNATQLVFTGNGVARTLVTSVLGKRGLGASWATGGTPIGYSDGLSLGNFSGVVTVTGSATTTELGNWNNSGQLKSPASAVLIANRILTETEHTAVFAELLAMRWPSKQSSMALARQIPNVAEAGLVAAWTMHPVNGEIIDAVGANNGTISGNPMYEKGILGDRMRFDGVDDYVDCGDIGTIKTFAFDVCPASTTEDLADLDGGTHTVEVAAGTLTATGWTAPTIYVDGVATTSLIANKTQRVVITTATGIAASAVKLATETTFLDGSLGHPRFYSDEKSASWVAQDYLEAARAVQFKTDWGYPISVADEGGTLHQQIGGHASPFRAGDTSGRWRVETDTIDGVECKALTCKTAGMVYVPASLFYDATPTEASYGTWDWWAYKADASVMDVAFVNAIATALDGYGVKWAADESVVVYEYGVGDVATGGTAAHSTWTRFRVTRSLADLFTGYIDGTSFGTGTDVTTTTSSYMVFDMDAGDKLALGEVGGDKSIVKKLGVEAP